MSARLTLVLASVAMFLAVALGAFGAHALKARLSAEMTAVWQTAVQYHAWHGLAIFGVGLLMRISPELRGLAAVAWCFLAGIVVFSGSLYLLAATGVTGLGAVTPVGGIAFLAGWATLAWAVGRA